mmetsp:Transcript_11085/g.46077  ORF Transcript_11085/g.46077 Transcript_11085/m.46077 type:complete len:349 (-) Transcript_11085:1498-2544(-)
MGCVSDVRTGSAPPPASPVASLLRRGGGSMVHDAIAARAPRRARRVASARRRVRAQAGVCPPANFRPFFAQSRITKHLAVASRYGLDATVSMPPLSDTPTAFSRRRGRLVFGFGDSTSATSRKAFSPAWLGWRGSHGAPPLPSSPARPGARSPVRQTAWKRPNWRLTLTAYPRDAACPPPALSMGTEVLSASTSVNASTMIGALALITLTARMTCSAGGIPGANGAPTPSPPIAAPPRTPLPSPSPPPAAPMPAVPSPSKESSSTTSGVDSSWSTASGGAGGLGIGCCGRSPERGGTRVHLEPPPDHSSDAAASRVSMKVASNTHSECVTTRVPSSSKVVTCSAGRRK